MTLSSDSSLIPVIPPEFQNLINALPLSQKESLLYSYQKLFSLPDDSGKSYLTLFEALEETFRVLKNPDPLLYVIYGKVGFFTARYDELINFWKGHDEPVELNPFIARVFAFQSKFSEGKHLIERAKEDLFNDELMITLFDAVIQYETLFTEGLLYMYAREFESIHEVIKALESLGVKYRYKRVLEGLNRLDYVSYEFLLQILFAFYNGDAQKFFDLVTQVDEWIDNVSDHWVRGFFFNLRGISYYMKQEAKRGEELMKKALMEYEVIRDLRGYSVVGANLGTGMILEGRKEEGRKIIEKVISHLELLKNYHTALSYMLTLSKSYLDENDFDRAKKYLDKAEKLRVETDLRDPASLALFSFLYSRSGDLEKTKQYLGVLRSIIGLPSFINEEASAQDHLFEKDLPSLTDEELDLLEKRENIDLYTKLWYFTAEGAYAIATSNLFLAQKILRKGVEEADKTQHFDTSLELSTLLLEIYLKNFLLSLNTKHMYQAIDLANDLLPLIMKSDNPYFITIYHIFMIYLYLGVNDASTISKLLSFVKSNINDTNSEQRREYTLLEQRLSDLKLLEEDDENYQLSTMLLRRWLDKDILAVSFTMEAIRLLKNLQFQQTSLGQKLQETEETPLQLMIMDTAGIMIYNYNFMDDKASIENDQLLSGFLTAVNAFTQEMFGKGSLRKIEQDNTVLLIEPISEELIAVLRVKIESYHVRKQFRSFIEELQEINMSDYITSGINLSEDDPFWLILDNIVKKRFNLE